MPDSDTTDPLARLAVPYSLCAGCPRRDGTIVRLMTLLADLYPIMKAEHDAGDGHFSTEELARVERELPHD